MPIPPGPPYNIPLLNLDPTGTNPNNLIVDEDHTLTQDPRFKNRSIAPVYGPFFTESVIVKYNNNILVKGVDYQLAELHVEASLKFGKEIASVIIIINENITLPPQNTPPGNFTISITYQALGGHYANMGTAIINMYNFLFNDNRPVNWNNIINRPHGFPPTIHRHLLEDLYGFEPVVDYLERIKRALTLAQTSVVVDVLRNVLGEFRCKELPWQFPVPKFVQFDSLLYYMTRKRYANNSACIDVYECKAKKGSTFTFYIDTQGFPVGQTIYWYAYRPFNKPIQTVIPSQGTITSNNSIVNVTVYIQDSPNITDDPLYFGIKLAPSDPDFYAVTYKIGMDENSVALSLLGFMIYMYRLEERIIKPMKDYNYFDDDVDLQLWFLSTGY